MAHSSCESCAHVSHACFPSPHPTAPTGDVTAASMFSSSGSNALFSPQRTPGPPSFLSPAPTSSTRGTTSLGVTPAGFHSTPVAYSGGLLSPPPTGMSHLSRAASSVADAIELLSGQGVTGVTGGGYNSTSMAAFDTSSSEDGMEDWEGGGGGAVAASGGRRGRQRERGPRAAPSVTPEASANSGYWEEVHPHPAAWARGGSGSLSEHNTGGAAATLTTTTSTTYSSRDTWRVKEQPLAHPPQQEVGRQGAPVRRLFGPGPSPQNQPAAAASLVHASGAPGSNPHNPATLTTSTTSIHPGLGVASHPGWSGNMCDPNPSGSDLLPQQQAQGLASASAAGTPAALFDTQGSSGSGTPPAGWLERSLGLSVSCSGVETWDHKQQQWLRASAPPHLLQQQQDPRPGRVPPATAVGVGAPGAGMAGTSGGDSSGMSRAATAGGMGAGQQGAAGGRWTGVGSWTPPPAPAGGAERGLTPSRRLSRVVEELEHSGSTLGHG